ncbi:murein DD-endopeptidase MepM [Kordia sp. SMS9]|uniref:M23/M56 family metallopeptidase n=1 Tax=Kordia sp. SMS9 TaxID=2282170 RepID=UPI000E0DEBAF|nr:M23/M56 family metallopeptidase [Kordia sp. SMS9]AXG71298.1 murein DD-endopeptidase MepM [Kordia sp. SMS9]
MNSWLLYILQANLVFGSFYLLYKWCFSRFTFHAFNRIFLLLLIPLSLLVPLSDALFPEMQFYLEIPLFDELAILSETATNVSTTTETENFQTIHYSFWIFSLYAIGVLCFLGRFVATTFKVFQLKSNSKPVLLHETKVYSANVAEVFSYFHWVFVPKSTATFIDACILTHEKAHISKVHSLDVLLAEMFIAMNWCNPLAYFYRKSIKSIHEFQADALVLQQEKVKKSSYLELLLASLEPKNTNPIYNYFSHPTLKKRIEMITKSPSKNNLKFVYILLIPVIGIACMAFKSPIMTSIPVETLPTAFVKEEGIPSLFPVKNKTVKHISSKFGAVRKHPKLKHKSAHGGIDIKAAKGTPIIATADGIVLKATVEGNWGNLIIISHDDGFETWYAHLQGFNTKLGATVQKGDIIGYVGNSGVSTAPHLHYEVRQHGKRLDPMHYISE